MSDREKESPPPDWDDDDELLAQIMEDTLDRGKNPPVKRPKPEGPSGTVH